MAPRDFMSSTAMDTVFENLDLDQNDFTVGDGNDDLNDDIGSDTGDDLGDDPDAEFADGGDSDPFAVDDGFDDDRRRQPDRDPQNRQQQQRGRGRGQQQNGRVSHTQQQRGRPGFQEYQPRVVKADNKGNLVDANGVIVAKAGTERRYYEDREKWRRESTQKDVQLRSTAGRLNRITQIAQRLKTENDANAAQRQTIEALGVGADEHVSALQLFSQLKRDAKGTLQKLLTRAAANGIVLDNSGSPNGTVQPDVAGVVKEILGTELKAVKDFVASQKQTEQQRRQELEQRSQAQQEVEEWFDQNPDARPYASVFSQVLRDPKYAGMSLGECWARIQLNLERQRRSGGQRMQGRNGSTPRGGRRGSIPMGRRTPPSGNSQMANVNESYDAILKDVLDEAGVV